MEYTLEVCCTGNNGRSPMAEAIGNWYLEQRRWQDTARFISSGTRADPQWDDILPYKKVVSVLAKASQNGIMEPVEVDEYRYETDKDYEAVIREKVKAVMKNMRSIESALRDAALHGRDLKYDGTRSQTIVRDDVSIVLGMEKRHVEEVKQIYSGVDEEQKPQIITLADYVNADCEIPDSIGNTNPLVYRKIRDILLDMIPRAVLRFKEEHDYDL